MKGLVWGYAFGDAVNMLHEIEANYNYIQIESTERKETKNDYWVKFANGDFWRAVRAQEHYRACRANISYVDRRINPDFVDQVIRPCTYLPPYNAIRYFDAPRLCWPEETMEGN